MNTLSRLLLVVQGRERRCCCTFPLRERFAFVTPLVTLLLLWAGTAFAQPAGLSPLMSGAARFAFQGFEDYAIPDCADSLAAALSVCQARPQACEGQMGDYEVCAKCILAYPNVDGRRASQQKDFDRWLKDIYKDKFLAGIVKSEAQCKGSNSKTCKAKSSFLSSIKDVSIGYTRALMICLVVFGFLVFAVYVFITRFASIRISRSPFIWMGAGFFALWVILLGVDIILLDNFTSTISDSTSGFASLQKELAVATSTRVKAMLDKVEQVGTVRCQDKVTASHLEDELQGAPRAARRESQAVSDTWADLAGKTDIQLDANDPGIPAGDIVGARRYFAETLPQNDKAFLGEIPALVTAMCSSPNIATLGAPEGNLCSVADTIPESVGYVIPLTAGQGVHDWLALWSLGALLFLFLGRFFELVAHKKHMAGAAARSSFAPRLILVVYLVGAVGCICAAVVLNLIL